MSRAKAPEGPRRITTAIPPAQTKDKPTFYVFKSSEDIDPREIVQSLVNGLDPALIAPEMYPHLFPFMTAQEARLRAANPSGAQKLRDSMDYMVNWRPRSDPVTVRVVMEEEIYKPTRQMIKEGLDVALSDGNLSLLEPKLLHFLIPPLTEKRRDSLCSGDYVAAQKADLACRRIREEQLRQDTLDIQEERTGEDSHRLEIAEIQLINIKEKWELMIQQKQAAMREYLANMQAEFANVLSEFDVQFENGPPKNKLKLSAACLDLRFKERHLSYSKRFTEAGKMKKLADAMTNRETKARTEEWTAELLAERQKMMDKENQLEHLREMAWDAIISKMQLDAAAEIAHAEKNVQFQRARKERSTTEVELTKGAKKLPPLSISSTSAAGRVRTAR
jgi:hypothetical protein